MHFVLENRKKIHYNILYLNSVLQNEIFFYELCTVLEYYEKRCKRHKFPTLVITWTVTQLILDDTLKMYLNFNL